MSSKELMSPYIEKLRILPGELIQLVYFIVLAHPELCYVIYDKIKDTGSSRSLYGDNCYRRLDRKFIQSMPQSYSLIEHSKGTSYIIEVDGTILGLRIYSLTIDANNGEEPDRVPSLMYAGLESLLEKHGVTIFG